MVATTLRLLFSSLVVFSLVFTFCCLSTFCEFFFLHTSVFNRPVGFWRPPLVFPACYLLCPHPSSFFSSCGFFFQSLCVVPSLLVLLPFLFCSNFVLFPQSIALLLHSLCFVALFAFLSPPFLVSPPFPVLVLISLSPRAPVEIPADVFSSLLQSFSCLEVCLSMFRSLSLCLSLKKLSLSLSLPVQNVLGRGRPGHLAQQGHVPARRDDVPNHRRVHEQDHVGPYSCGRLRAPAQTTGWCSQDGHVLLSPPIQRGRQETRCRHFAPSASIRAHEAV